MVLKYRTLTSNISETKHEVKHEEIQRGRKKEKVEERKRCMHVKCGMTSFQGQGITLLNDKTNFNRSIKKQLGHRKKRIHNSF